MVLWLRILVLSLAGALLACGVEPAERVAPRIVVEVDRSACSCTPVSYRLALVMMGTATFPMPSKRCIYRDVELKTGQSVTLTAIDLPAGSALTVALDAVCSIPFCASCTGRTDVSLEDGAEVALTLSDTRSCLSDLLAMQPCTLQR